jgi:CheY-like chemotaxis protein
VLSITDSGAGLEPETLEHLSDPFTTLRSHVTGAGIGLSTVYGCVRQLGGDIVVESRTAATDERGTGTTFALYLPAAGDEPEPLAESPPPTRRGTETIALAEDDRVVRDLAERVLVREGYHVISASNGRQAMNAIVRHPGRIDLLIADVVMPEMNGRDLADRVMAMRPGARILFMSGHVDDLVGHHGVFAAGTDYLEKPFSPDVLLRKVRELLDPPPGG